MRFETSQTRAGEARVVQQLLVLGLAETATRLPQGHAFDWRLRNRKGELLVEIKVMNELSNAHPETFLVSLEKYQAAQELADAGRELRLISQYLDACVCFQFSRAPLPSFPASDFRPDRPHGRTVMMPKLSPLVLWLGTIVDYQPRIGLLI